MPFHLSKERERELVSQLDRVCSWWYKSGVYFCASQQQANAKVVKQEDRAQSLNMHLLLFVIHSTNSYYLLYITVTVGLSEKRRENDKDRKGKVFLFIPAAIKRNVQSSTRRLFLYFSSTNKRERETERVVR